MIIGINFAPEIISTGVYTTGMAKFLAKKGHKVSVIAAHPYYPEWRIAKGWPRFRYIKEELDQDNPTLSVTHCPLYVPIRPTGLRRIAHHASFTLTSIVPALASCFSKSRPNVIIVVAPSLLSALTGLIVAKICNSKTWLHIQDFEVEAALATGLLKSGGFIGILALGFERFILNKFDKVSTISKAMRAKLVKKRVAIHKITELRNWADLDLVCPGPVDEEMRAMLGISTSHIVLYSGNIANKQGLEILPKVARLLAHRDDITLLICGAGPMLKMLREDCKDLPRVKFTPLQPRERLCGLLRLADIHILPQIAGAADLVLPSKLKNILASGRPVIATADKHTALADEIGDAGIVSEPGNAVELAKHINQLIDNPKRRKTMGKRGWELARTRWSHEEILGDFEGQIMDLSLRISGS